MFKIYIIPSTIGGRSRTLAKEWCAARTVIRENICDAEIMNTPFDFEKTFTENLELCKKALEEADIMIFSDGFENDLLCRALHESARRADITILRM